MVFQTLMNFARQARQGSPSTFWRKRKVLKLTAVSIDLLKLLLASNYKNLLIQLTIFYYTFSTFWAGDGIVIRLQSEIVTVLLCTQQKLESSKKKICMR